MISVSRSFATQYQEANGKLDLAVLPKPWSIDSKEDVYRLLTDIRFYDEFLPGVEWLLKFESDSIMCANSDDSLNDWLDYSWAGAPRYADIIFFNLGVVADTFSVGPKATDLQETAVFLSDGYPRSDIS